MSEEQLTAADVESVGAVVVMETKIAEYSKTAAALADLRAKYAKTVYDVTTGEGMRNAIKARAEVRGYRVDLEKMRQDLKAPALERSRLIDAEAKRIREELEALEIPIDEQIKAEETRKERERAQKAEDERQRIAGIQEHIAGIGARPAECVGKPSAEIREVLHMVRGITIEPAVFCEFVTQAAEAKGKAVATLEQLYAGAFAQEAAQAERERQAAADRAELERLRNEENERQRLAAEQRAREQAEADQRAAAAAEEQREARERIAREEREAKAIREEADRVAEAQRKEAKERQDAVDAEQRADRERLEAERREVQRQQQELLDGDDMLRNFVQRFGKRPEFAAVVKAVNAYLRSKVIADAKTIRAEIVKDAAK